MTANKQSRRGTQRPKTEIIGSQGRPPKSQPPVGESSKRLDRAVKPTAPETGVTGPGGERGGDSQSKMDGTAGRQPGSLAAKARGQGSCAVRVDSQDPSIELWILKERG